MSIGEPLKGHTFLSYILFRQHSARVASSSRDCIVWILDAMSGGLIGLPLQGHPDTVCSVAYSPDSTRTSSGSDDRVRMWGIYRTSRLASHAALYSTSALTRSDVLRTLPMARALCQALMA